MTEAVDSSPIYLLDTATNSPVEATLLHGITEQQLLDWETEWLPEHFRLTQCLRRAGVDRAQWPQHRHWSWRAKTEAIKGLLAHAGFSIICDGVTQGMMIVDTATRRCRHPAQHGMNLVYVDYLENAPWNRTSVLANKPRYKGVGSILVAAAISLSHDEEFDGRIGLHSLPQANQFYEHNCRMSNLGIDPDYENLSYFEMTVQQAQEFMQKGDRS